MLRFGKHWSEEIAEVTGSSEYQTCEVTITDVELVESEWDWDAGEYIDVIPPEATIYEGQARLIAVRRGVNYEGSVQHNSKTITSIRIQLPGGSLPVRLKKSFTARVTSAPLNPTLETYVFTLASDIHGSSAATRTLEFNVDGDSVGD